MTVQTSNNIHDHNIEIKSTSASVVLVSQPISALVLVIVNEKMLR